MFAHGKTKWHCALLRAAFTVQTGSILYKTYRTDGRHFHEDKGGDNDALESEQCAETAVRFMTEWES
jgi:hypothetical protein